MRFNLLCLLAISVAIVCLSSFLFSPSQGNTIENDNAPNLAAPEANQSMSTRSRFQLPKMFDFQLYKRLFHKAYGHLEEMVRRKYVMARAFRAWTSSIKYKFRLSSFYLALNPLSDRSPEELEQTLNHQSNFDISELENVLIIDNVQTNHYDLHQGSKLIKEQQRKKRQAAQVEDRVEGVGESNDESLISKDEGVQLNPAIVEKIQVHPDIETTSVGARERNVQEPTWKLIYRLGFSDDQDSDWLSVNEASFFSGRDDPTKPDEVFFDHRQSNCLLPPRDQGLCGSCYAFTAIALAEWLHCKRTGKLVAFSEQYMVDCGPSVGTRGCIGGNVYQMGKFIHNFGMELLEDYPYQETQNQCPYDQNTSPKSMGYIRMEMEASTVVPIRHLEQYIQYGPMYIAVSTKNGLPEYGGGVIGGAGCEAKGDHAVVLIGHGREDGQEYWLIRNSQSVAWGERGHFKLAKESDCIHSRYGVLFGTENGHDFTHKLRENPHYQAQTIKNHHLNLPINITKQCSSV